MFEVNEAAEVIHGVAHPDANIIFGTVVDDELGDEVRVTVIAAGFDRWDDGKEKDEKGSVPAKKKVVKKASAAAGEAPAAAPAGAPGSLRHPLEPDDVFEDSEEESAEAAEDDMDVPDFLK